MGRAAARQSPARRSAPAGVFPRGRLRTFSAGKADTARLPESSPWDRGWDQGYFVSGYQHRDPTLPNRGKTLEAKGWTVDLVTDLILDFVREPRPEPWFATAAYSNLPSR